jgi:hypothetical protein
VCEGRWFTATAKRPLAAGAFALLACCVISCCVLGGACLAASVPLKLTVSQRQLVWSEIWKSSVSAIPIGFEASVGTPVPDAIRLQSLPQNVIERVPAIKDATYVKTRNQVILVDPLTRNVVAVIKR